MAVKLRLKKIQEAKILLSMIRYAGSDGSIDSKNSAFFEEINSVIPNGNDLENYLYEINEKGIATYEEIGEDGFPPIIIAGVNHQTYKYLADLITQIGGEVEELERYLKELLTFDPVQLIEEIANAQAKLEEAKQTAENNEILKPILDPIEKIQRHFGSVSSVASTYEDVYKNIIRPVQREGEAGVRATVRWAIISIIVSTVLSMLISNWSAISRIWDVPNKPLLQSSEFTLIR